MHVEHDAQRRAGGLVCQHSAIAVRYAWNILYFMQNVPLRLPSRRDIANQGAPQHRTCSGPACEFISAERRAVTLSIYKNIMF